MNPNSSMIVVHIRKENKILSFSKSDLQMFSYSNLVNSLMKNAFLSFLPLTAPVFGSPAFSKALIKIFLKNVREY